MVETIWTVRLTESWTPLRLLYKLLRYSGWVRRLVLWLPETSLICKFPYLLNLPPTNLEWSASSLISPCPPCVGTSLQTNIFFHTMFLACLLSLLHSCFLWVSFAFLTSFLRWKLRLLIDHSLFLLICVFRIIHFSLSTLLAASYSFDMLCFYCQLKIFSYFHCDF